MRPPAFTLFGRKIGDTDGFGGGATPDPRRSAAQAHRCLSLRATTFHLSMWSKKDGRLDAPWSETPATRKNEIRLYLA